MQPKVKVPQNYTLLNVFCYNNIQKPVLMFPPPPQVWSQADQSGVYSAQSLQQWHQSRTLRVHERGRYWGRQRESVRPEGHLQTHH